MNLPFPVYLPFLLLTLAIEAPLVTALVARRCGLLRGLVMGVLPSSVTHPLLWFVWPHVVSAQHHYWAYVVSGELLVVLIEAGILAALARPRTHLITHEIGSNGEEEPSNRPFGRPKSRSPRPEGASAILSRGAYEMSSREPFRNAERRQTTTGSAGTNWRAPGRLRLAVGLSVLSNFASWSIGMLLHAFGLLWPYVTLISGWMSAAGHP